MEAIVVMFLLACAGMFFLVVLFGCFRTIEQGTVAVITRFGKFARVMRPGLNFKVPLIENGRWGYSRETVLNQYQLRLPMVDVASIGAGGGSIARVDSGGAFRVGPKSAGANPGPACYGRGGTQPTVTDADVVLGYIDPARFLGGDMVLDRDAAKQAITQHVATPLDKSVVDAAWGIFMVVNEAMVAAANPLAAAAGLEAFAAAHPDRVKP